MAAWASSPASAQLEGKLTISIPDGGEIYGFELFDEVPVGTQIPADGPGNGLKFYRTGGTAPADQVWTVNNDNDELYGNHFDGDSAGEGFFGQFTMEQDGPDDLPTDDTYYVNLVMDNYVSNFSGGLFNSAKNTQHEFGYFPDQGWRVFAPVPDNAHSGADIFDPTKPTFVSTAVNVETGFLLTYSHTAAQPSTGAFFAHVPVATHIPGFGTPQLRMFFDRRAGQDGDADQIVTSNSPILTPEPTSIALLGLGSVLMLRSRR